MKLGMRWRYTQLGGHIHVRVFTSTNGVTFANCGKLVFNVEEWPGVKELIPYGVEILPNKPPHAEEINT